MQNEEFLSVKSVKSAVRFFRGNFIVFHPADSSVNVAAGRVDRDDTTKRLRKLLRKLKR